MEMVYTNQKIVLGEIILRGGSITWRRIEK